MATIPQRKAGWAWVTLPLLQSLLLIFIARPASPAEGLLFASFVAVTAFSSFRLFADDRPYSLNQVWWLFGAVFLGMAPSAQAALHQTPWRNGDLLPQTMLRVNLLVLGCLLLYACARRLLQQKLPAIAVPHRRPPDDYVRRFRLLAVPLLLLCGAGLLWAYGWQGLFLRGYLEARSQAYNTTFQLLGDKLVRGLILYLSLSAILLRRQRRISAAYCGSVLTLAFLLNFPLAVPRYLAFTFYVSWLLSSGWALIRRRHTFVLLILALLLVAAPLADVARYAGTDMGARLQRPAALFEKAYLATDYDAYSSLCRTVQFTDTAGTTRGRQLGGVLLFFVPRSLWPDKPIGSGAYLFTQLQFDFKNVSCAYLAEGYINFGVAGSLLFALIMAVLATCYDHWFAHSGPAGNFSYARLFYPVAAGMLLFMLRGDLLSSTAFTCGLFAGGWLLHRLLLAGIQKNKRYNGRSQDHS